MSERFLLDTSAWSRFSHPNLSQERAEQVAGAIARGEVVLSLPVLLEIGYSARTRREHEELMAELLALPRVAVDEEIERRAIEAQSELARDGHHRLAPPDLIVAALAGRHGLGVLHYDADYDVIREHTGLDFESLWLAPAGAL